MTPDHDYESTAAQLKMSAAWLKKNIRDLPHQKYGRKVRFTDEQIAEIRRRFERRPDEAAAPTTELRPSTRSRRAS